MQKSFATLDRCGNEPNIRTGYVAGIDANAGDTTWSVATYPCRNLGNPYIELFYGALEPYRVQHAGGVECTRKWLRENSGRIDAIHFHWPERLWRGRPKGRVDRALQLATAAAPRSVFGLRRFLDAAAEAGIKRIWTVHNLECHEGAGWVDWQGYRTLARSCDALITHSRWAASEVRRMFPDAETIVPIHRGTYAGAYPAPNPPGDVLSRIGIPADGPVIACVGVLRRYKGVELACEAARRLGSGVRLVVAGRPKPAEDQAYWRDVIRRVPGAVFIDRSLDDQEFSDVIAASDVILQSYNRITGSGLLFAAWTFEKGVVASDLPFFREMLEEHPDAGRLFRAGEAADLSRAIKEYLAIPEKQRRAAVRQAAEAHSWDRVIAPVAELFRHWREVA